MRFADARFAASIMMSCSMIESFTLPQCVWMMKTSAPRMFSPYWQWISPFGKSRTLTSPSGTPRRAREDRDGGGETHRRVDVRPVGIDHRHAGAEPGIVDAPSQLGLGRGQLPAIVDALRFDVVGREDRHDRVAGIAQHLDDIGQ